MRTRVQRCAACDAGHAMILWLTTLGAAALGFWLLYFYVLACAGLRGHRPDRPREPIRRFAVVIPAHNEELVIGDTVRQLLRQDYPRALFSVFALADNCDDRTAAVAAAAGATCLERHAPAHRGKGHVLAWALPRILAWHPARCGRGV